MGSLLLSEPGSLEGVGWGLFQQKQEQPLVLEFFLLPLLPLLWQEQCELV